jgi:hypothetical protein
MVKIARLFTLTLEAVLLQIVNGIGVVALLIALAAGYFRAPLWSVPVLAVAFGSVVEHFDGWVSFSDKAESATGRWAFSVLIYFLIALVGYLAGIFGRRRIERRKKPAASR